MTPTPGPQAPAVRELPLSQLTHSPFNARKSFDPVKLNELADSIKEKGVIQPIIVRPVKKDFEIVAGERRFRAAKLAGLTTIPAIVKQLDDKAAAEIQVIENDQREDLEPLERAAGYAVLIKNFKYTAESLAAKIGKSKTYVYGFLKLNELPPAAAAMLREGKLPRSVAELIARIPNDQLRTQATKDILHGGGYQEPCMSFRTAKDHIERRYMIQLKGAPFPLDQKDIYPGAIACSDCPKMTGNNRTEFPDGRGDMCTDPANYAKKVEGWKALQTIKAATKGLTIATASQLKEIFPYGGSQIGAGYVDLADQCNQDKKRRSFKQLLGDALKPIYAQDAAGHGHHVVPYTDAKKILNEKGISRTMDAGDARWKKQQATERKKREAIKAKTEAIITAAIKRADAARTIGSHVDAFAVLLCDPDPKTSAIGRLTRKAIEAATDSNGQLVITPKNKAALNILCAKGGAK